MGKLRGRCPEVEMLESMTLLSALGGAAIANPLDLVGSTHGTYHVSGGESKTKGSGSVSPLGHVTESGISTLGGGNVTMSSAKEGKLFLALNLKRSTAGFAGTYTITGGTKALAGEHGTGTVQVSFGGALDHGSYTTVYG